jgi:hypothetical protein
VILNAFGGDSALPITRSETEILLDVHKAVGARPVPPAWTDLLAKAMANVVLAEHGYSVPPRAVALRPWSPADPALALEDQVGACLGHLRVDYHRQSVEERALARLERQRIEIVTGETIAGEDQSWLTERLVSGYRRSALETAVLAHLDRECLIGDAAAAGRSRDGKAA